MAFSRSVGSWCSCPEALTFPHAVLSEKDKDYEMQIEDKRAKDGMLNVLDPILKTIACDYVDEVPDPIVGQYDAMDVPAH